MADPFADIAPPMLSQNIMSPTGQQQQNAINNNPMLMNSSAQAGQAGQAQQQQFNSAAVLSPTSALQINPLMNNNTTVGGGFNSMHAANAPPSKQISSTPNPFENVPMMMMPPPVQQNAFNTAPPKAADVTSFDPFATTSTTRAPAPVPPSFSNSSMLPPASRPVAPLPPPPIGYISSDDENDESVIFDGTNFQNPDDTPRASAGLDTGGFTWDNLPTSPEGGPSSFVTHTEDDEEEEGEDDENNVYEVTFAPKQKLGVLMERVDKWQDGDVSRREAAVVKLVVENGAADAAGVTPGSVVLGINGRDLRSESYGTVLSLVKTAPRPLVIRFHRVRESKDETQGHVLTRISGGTFSVGNLTSGNARWTPKYFAFGGSRMDVLQLFVSRAAYHECVIALYEKRAIHTEIQSFRLCRDHKVTTIKSKVYKGYGNLHYFSLNVPSLHFVAAKFASDDYESIKSLWTLVYDAVENQKRMMN